MTTKKRTSTKRQAAAPQSKADDLDARIQAADQADAKMAAAKHWIFRQLFPSYGAAIARLGDPTARLGNSDAMRQIRMQADEKWKALTGLPTLDAYNPDRWFMVAVAAGYSVREARRMTLEELREVILPWALAKRAEAAGKSKADDTLRERTTNRDTGYKPAALAGELGLNSTATVNKYAKAAGINTPRRGERNYTYSVADTEKLCRYLSTQGSDSSTRNKAKRLLEMLPKIAR